MTRITADISVSLDGSSPGPTPARTTVWAPAARPCTRGVSDDPDDRRVLREGTARSGAVVLGRHLFDVVDALTLHLVPIVLGVAHAGAAERDLDIDRDAPDLRRLPVIR